MLRKSAFVILLFSYGLLFIRQELDSRQYHHQLNFPLPIEIEKAGFGYLRQFGSEMHFIQAAVYAGALLTRGERVSEADSLSANFNIAAQLHPPFIDTYFYCESFLAPQGEAQARQANDILKIGMTELPENWTLPFFIGFNHFYYLNEPRVAADFLLAATKLPGAPSWFAHLASVLAAKGGDIYAGLIWLKAMRQSEKEEGLRRRYESEIVVFEAAMKVQMAIFAYRDKYGPVPTTLEMLVPESLAELPDIQGDFKLVWEPPKLRLERPHHRR